MSNPLIVDQSEFEELCEHIRDEGIVAFDTEFVSEHTYRPELCLLQMATPQRCVAVDPFRVKDLTSWWNVMTDDQTTVVAHAGREEVRFCVTVTGQRPHKLVDVQIAEGLRSCSYPLGYERLVTRVLDKRLHGNQTRTDWRRRPLTDRQIDYALDDVRFVLEIWQRQKDSLQSKGRYEWADAEFHRMIDEVASERTRENWRRLSGIQKLRSRELAVARSLFRWREHEAEETNEPIRRILRDDLLIDLARRHPSSASEVLATRDMNRSNFKRFVPQLIECIADAMSLPDSDLPKRAPKQESNEDEHVLGKLLAIALANRCAELDVANSLVGTNADLRHLVRWHVYSETDGPQPRLSEGWRAEVCGDLLTDVLDGRISLRVSNPESDHPLTFERRES